MDYPELKNQLLRRVNDLRMIASPQAARVTSTEPDQEAEQRWAIVEQLDKIEKQLQSLPTESTPITELLVSALNRQLDAIAKNIEATEQKDNPAAAQRSTAEWIRQERKKRARKTTQALAETPAKSLKAARTKPSNMYPKRAAWLDERLRERGWNEHELWRHGGPDHKTAQKILRGERVHPDVLVKVAQALSTRREFPPVKLTDIPNG